MLLIFLSVRNRFKYLKWNNIKWIGTWIEDEFDDIINFNFDFDDDFFIFYNYIKVNNFNNK